MHDQDEHNDGKFPAMVALFTEASWAPVSGSSRSPVSTAPRPCTFSR
jgi:hypothetical protein